MARLSTVFYLLYRFTLYVNRGFIVIYTTLLDFGVAVINRREKKGNATNGGGGGQIQVLDAKLSSLHIYSLNLILSAGPLGSIFSTLLTIK